MIGFATFAAGGQAVHGTNRGVVGDTIAAQAGEAGQFQYWSRCIFSVFNLF